MLMRKTELKRTAFAPKQPKPAPGSKLKKCKVRTCRKPFEPNPKQPFKDWCSDDCGAVLGAEKLVKLKAKARRQERAQDKVKREGMKTIPKLKAEVQKVFNEFIRIRDAGKPCICCGKFATASALAKPGGAYDACHFRSRGSADHTRYNEDNVHLGLKDCNTWGHKDYRGGLIERIGLERVEALEANQELVKWTHDGLREMKAYYQRRVRELKGKL
jgi:hypothetical protein